MLLVDAHLGLLIQSIELLALFARILLGLLVILLIQPALQASANGRVLAVGGRRLGVSICLAQTVLMIALVADVARCWIFVLRI